MFGLVGRNPPGEDVCNGASGRVAWWEAPQKNLTNEEIRKKTTIFSNHHFSGTMLNFGRVNVLFPKLFVSRNQTISSADFFLQPLIWNENWSL